MPNLTQLRLAAREIFDETLREIDPGVAFAHAVRLDGSQLSVLDTTVEVANRKIYSIAIGKAAGTMASALEQALGSSFERGVISGPPLLESTEGPERRLSSRWLHSKGGHPLPNDDSLLAATAAFALLQRANEERALVIFLISGGGSAMLESPLTSDITLKDLQAAHQSLVNCGASISEVNAVRRAFSAVKGGRLAAHAPNCDQLTLIVSDVPKGEERSVASGPTLMPPNDAPNAREVIERYDLSAQLPESVVRAIEVSSSPPENNSTLLRKHFVLLDNHSALEAAAAAAKRRGFDTEIAEDISDQPIDEGCRLLISRLKALHDRTEVESSGPKSVCLISGGEFACPVNGEGLGGRSAETALRLATKVGLSPTTSFVALCAGTDGIDGNSPAAGAIVDETTLVRAEAIGLDSSSFIDRSDAYSFFVAIGDSISTGITGTNVRDIRILLANGK
jgi:hydroxypyruvate reductase